MQVRIRAQAKSLCTAGGCHVWLGAYSLSLSGKSHIHKCRHNKLCHLCTSDPTIYKESDCKMMWRGEEASDSSTLLIRLMMLASCHLHTHTHTLKSTETTQKSFQATPSTPRILQQGDFLIGLHISIVAVIITFTSCDSTHSYAVSFRLKNTQLRYIIKYYHHFPQHATLSSHRTLWKPRVRIRISRSAMVNTCSTC